VLSWGELFASVWTFSCLSCRIVFHRKLFFMVGGVLCYYAVLYGLAVFRPGEGFSAGRALHVLVEIPGTVLAIYLAMDIVARERDRNSLEILFSTSTSHYSIWIFRLISIYAVLLLTLMVQSTLAYFLFAEFPFVWGGLNAFVPAFLVVNLTFFLAILCRSGNTAGMLALAFIIAVLLSAEYLKDTPYSLFLNPLDPPLGTDDSLWYEEALCNRLAVAAAGLLCCFFALRQMESRERLLA